MKYFNVSKTFDFSPKLSKDKPKMKSKDDSLVVAVRIRPISESEVQQDCTEIVNVVEENMVCMLDPADSDYDILRANRSREKTYVFDHVFGAFSTQKEVYNQTTKTLVESVLEGYNATIFAYGPTGAGKTHTMLGTDTEPGIMVFTLNYLYQEMHRTRHDQTYKVKMSYLEIYNEMVRDLLNPSFDFLDLREDSKGVQVAGLTEYEALTTQEIMELLSRGNKERMCEPTAVNKTSSRSHAILQVTVEQRSRVRNIFDEVKVAKLFMIDLAGSERAAQTQNTGKRLIEGAHINRSLLALGNCINALSDKSNKAGSYINYRDSKLTRLLKDSLGGNCKTVMIAHVSPASMSFEETRNTLTYADRAKSIKVKAKKNHYNVNYHVAQYQNIISDLRQEIIRLKTQLVEADSLQCSSARSFVVRSKSANVMEKLKEEMKAGFQEQLNIRKELIELEDAALQFAVEYQKNELIIDEWKQEETKQHARENIKGKRNELSMKEVIRAYKISRRDTFRIVKDANQLIKGENEPFEIRNAREEMENISIELSHIEKQKQELNEKLEECKKENDFLEELFPKKISNEEKRELLISLCKIHEYQIKNIELESKALTRDYLIKQKEIALQRNMMRNNLVTEIIETQRCLIKDSNVRYPPNLASLYSLYKDHFAQDQVAMSTLAIDASKTNSQVPALPTLVINSKPHSTNCISVQKQRKKSEINFNSADNSANNSDQESFTSSKFILSKNRFPATVFESIDDSDLEEGSLRNLRASPCRSVVSPNIKKPMQGPKLHLKSQGKKSIEDYHSRKSMEENRLSYNALLLNRFNHKLSRLQVDTDNESIMSLQTSGPIKNESSDDNIERKRSASAELTRERQKYNVKSFAKKKVSVGSKERPTWNSNFTTKAGSKSSQTKDVNILVQSTMKSKNNLNEISRTNGHKLKPHASLPPLEPRLPAARTKPSTRISDYGLLRHERLPKGPLTISGTNFTPKPKQPGFARM